MRAPCELLSPCDSDFVLPLNDTLAEAESSPGHEERRIEIVPRQFMRNFN